MHEYFQVLGSVLPIFGVMAIGVLARRLKILNASADRTLLDLTVKVLMPSLILDHVMSNDVLRQWGNLLWSPLLGFITTGGGVLVALAAARLTGMSGEARIRTFAFVTGVPNYGYVAVPLTAVLFGGNALAVLFLFNLGTEVAFWVIGFTVMEGRALFSDWRRTLTMPVRAVLLGVTINLLTAQLGFRIDDATLDVVSWGWPVKLLTSTVHSIGLCAIPMALIMIGATMADFWQGFHSRDGLGVMALSILVRNVVCPVAYLLMVLCPVSRELQETLVVQAAMPAGMLTLALARHHGGNVPVALQVIYATSAMALITLPLWIHFGMQWTGLR